MAAEGVKRAVIYLIILSAIFTIFVVVDALIETKTLLGDFSQYVQENIPEFSYDQGKLKMEIQETMVINDVQYPGIDRIVIDTLAENNEQKAKVENDNTIIGMTVFLFDDKILLKTKTESEQTSSQPYTYAEFIEAYVGKDIEKFNKEELVQYLGDEKVMSIYIKGAVLIYFVLFAGVITVGLMNVLQVAILGWITTMIARIKMRFSAIYSMAVYSLTLPMILNIVYLVINYFTEFTIEYFQVAYIAIAYIYLAASIFILKDDFIKKMQEVEKIKQEQLKVREEIKEEEREEQKEKEDPKEDNKENEPQGSEG